MNPYYKWVSVEPSICTPCPPCCNKAEGFQNEHLKNSMNFWGLSELNVWPKIPAGDKINPKKYDKPLICRSPNPSVGVSISMLKHVTEIWDLRYAYQRLINDQLV